MKRIIRLFSIILLMFILLINVKAVTINTNSTAGTVDTNSRLVTNTGTLSVTNVTSTDTFKAYKVIDTFYNSTTNNIIYEFTSTFKTFLQNASGTISVSESTKNISALTVADYQALTSGNTTNGSTTTSSTLDILLSKYASYVKTNSVTGTNMTVSGTTASASVAAGSYMVLPTSTQSVYAVMANNVAFTGDGTGWTLNNATIVAKKSDPSISLWAPDFTSMWQNNSNNQYNLSFTIPTYPTNATNKTLVVEWDFGNYSGAALNSIGFQDYLSLNSSTGVITDSTTNANVGTATLSNNKLTVTLNADNLTQNSYELFCTTVKNNTTVLGSAGNNITGKLTYANNPYSTGTTYITDTQTEYYYGVKVFKKNSSNTALPGGEFKLCLNTSGNTCLLDYGTATSDSSGYATFPGILYAATEFGSAGATITVQELKAPSGYRLDTTPKTITIDTSSAYTTYNFVNDALPLLPATGGTGTYIYTGVGAALMIGAVLILIVKNKKKK